MSMTAQLGHELSASSALGESARALAPLADRYAEFADEQGELAPELVDALHEAGLFGMWVPQQLGGSELDPVASLEVIENMSYGCANAGWVVMAANLSTGTAGSFLADHAVAEMFGKERFPVIAGQGTRPGMAHLTDGGQLLSGSWSFASGLKHGQYVHSLGIIAETGEPRIFVTPVEQAVLIDNWDVMGLRGTGSIDYTMDNVFVPDGFSHFAVTQDAVRGGSLYHVGIIGFATICHSGWALGVGRRLLDELAAMVESKAGRPGAQADSESFLEGFAQAEASMRAARALIYEQWSGVRDVLARDEYLSTRQNTLIRVALAHVTKTLGEVANFVYLKGGTTALRRGTVQRLMRDVHAGTQHVTSSPMVWQNCGRELSGVAADKHWQFLDLVG
jgi:indole-3-acetate monooxygenase